MKSPRSIDIATAFDLTLPTIEADLALDEALLIAADERGAGASLRFWEAREVAVVLGATGKLLEDVDVNACRADCVTIARRSSGGGTVVVGPGALNVSLVLASNAAPGLGAVDRAQAFVLERIAQALRTLGVAAEVRGHGDVTINGRKCAGSAQRRLRDYFLVHATVLYGFPLSLISRYTTLPRRQPAYRAGRSHADFVVNLERSRDELVRAIGRAWCETSEWAPSSIPEDLVSHLVETKFGTKEWVERL
ncbi:MAG: lipoate--protein ligase family protein [Isosphaeraceae bacterium]|nr:lipoate--protein ligase family protein [Isosphaeraceae bacterium]